MVSFVDNGKVVERLRNTKNSNPFAQEKITFYLIFKSHFFLRFRLKQKMNKNKNRSPLN